MQYCAKPAAATAAEKDKDKDKNKDKAKAKPKAASKPAAPVAPHDPVSKRKEETKIVRAMNVTRIRAELIQRGLDVTGLIEKQELVDKLVEARVEGVQAFLPGGSTPARFEPPCASTIPESTRIRFYLRVI